MKNLIKGCIVLLTVMEIAGCIEKKHQGIYVAQLRSEYSVAEDTIELKGDIIINRVGYRRITNGRLMKKEFSFKTWKTNSPNAPIIEFGENQITIGRSLYKKIK